MSFELSSTNVGTTIQTDCVLTDSSALLGELNINDDNNGSGSALQGATKHEDPPRRDCKVPSLNSLLNKENVELDVPLRNLLLCCT